MKLQFFLLQLKVLNFNVTFHLFSVSHASLAPLWQGKSASSWRVDQIRCNSSQHWSTSFRNRCSFPAWMQRKWCCVQSAVTPVDHRITCSSSSLSLLTKSVWHAKKGIDMMMWFYLLLGLQQINIFLLHLEIMIFRLDYLYFSIAPQHFQQCCDLFNLYENRS